MLKKWVLSAVIMLLCLGTVMLPGAFTANADAKTDVTIHYKPAAGNALDWNLWLWEDGKDGKAYPFNGKDDFGQVARHSFEGSVKKIGFIVRTEDWQKDIGEDRFIENIAGETEIWLKSGDPKIYTSNPDGDAPAEQKSFDQIKVKLHYHRFDNRYDGWNVWMWPDKKDGASYLFTGQDEFGEIAEITVPNMKDVDQIGFIVRLSDPGNEWASKEFSDRFITKWKDDGTAEVWIAQNQETVYYKQEYVDLAPKIAKATMEDMRSVTVETTIPFPVSGTGSEGFAFKTAGGEIPIASVTPLDKDDNGLARKATLVASKDFDFQQTYSVTKEGYQAAPLTYGQVFGSKAFDDMFRYDGGDLGADYSAQETNFRVWAPTASEVKLVAYPSGDGGTGTEQTMAKAEKGTWTATLKGDKNGTFYTYKVLINGQWNEAVDPYARSVGINGDRGAVLDMAKTNPEGWEKQQRPKIKHLVDAIIYELHIRDLSIAPDSGIKNKGKFLGLTETGTKGPNGTATGIDHIKDLGVTHVQLLPFFDYNSVDEKELDKPGFNWGYDPKNYNAPEGSYSTDPRNPAARVGELKQAVQALHNNGLQVMMDVVYNHMYSVEPSNLNKLVPGYYFRYGPDGKQSNGSGVGNDTASERSMTSKLIVDSVVHWAKEYQLDGFRFDLMGIHDIATMNKIRAELDKIDPTMVIVGEGWVLGTTLDDKFKANQKHASELPRIGQFNDAFRDGAKGSVFNKTQGGFVNGNKSGKTKLMGGIAGGIRYSFAIGNYAVSPEQSVNYVEAHDNNTLWDKIELTSPQDSEDSRIKMDKMAGALVFTSQGISFMHAGQEFLRTKGGNENSYNAPDEVNRLDWGRKAKYQDVVDYYKGMIELRKAHPAFRMTTAEDIKKNLKFINTPADLIGFTINGHANGDEWETIAVFHNAARKDQQVQLPEGKWKVVMNGEQAGTKVIAKLNGNQVTVPALTSMVLYSGVEAQSGTAKWMIVAVIVAAVAAIALIGWLAAARRKRA